MPTRANKSASSKRTAKKTAPRRPLAPAAKKKLAQAHLRQLVEEKKRRDAQPRPWQMLDHGSQHVPTPVEPTLPPALPPPHKVQGEP